jgi:hypothetical protein
MTYPHYFESFDYAAMLREHPIGEGFSAGFARRRRKPRRRFPCCRDRSEPR